MKCSLVIVSQVILKHINPRIPTLALLEIGAVTDLYGLLQLEAGYKAIHSSCLTYLFILDKSQCLYIPLPFFTRTSIALS